MKTCPKCGAPQADILPTCDLCGFLFPGEKKPKEKRFDITGPCGLVNSLLAIAATVFFFYMIETYDDVDPGTVSWLITSVFATLFVGATGPIAGFVLSIAGIKKTRDRNVTGRGFAVAGIIISSIMLLMSALFIFIIIYVIVMELTV